MPDQTFVYVTYIRTTPEKLWQALTEPEFTRLYWCGCTQESTWEPGAAWSLMIPDGRVGDTGRVLEIDKPRRLVLEWRNEFKPDLRVEGYSRCVFELEPSQDPAQEMVKLTVTHSMAREESKFIAAVSNGWPGILSSLKSLLETGESLEAMRNWPKGM
jgi:uncharacterized protein YndB with AHSA1/START domain